MNMNIMVKKIAEYRRWSEEEYKRYIQSRET